MTVIPFQKPTTSRPLFSADPVIEDLILSFRFCADLGLDDLTYTHISARAAPESETYFINALGPLFEEMTPELLVKMNLDGHVLGAPVGMEANSTGQQIHGALYKARPDINAILHLHTIEGTAVAALEEGLSFCSQFSFHFVNNLSYHDYGGLVLAGEEGKKLVESLGPTNKAMIMRNHGLLTVGRTMAEAFFYMYYLHQACRVQLLAKGTGERLHLPEAEVQHQAHEQMQAFEPDLGQRDWQALLRRYRRTYGEGSVS